MAVSLEALEVRFARRRRADGTDNSQDEGRVGGDQIGKAPIE